MLKTKARIKD